MNASEARQAALDALVRTGVPQYELRLTPPFPSQGGSLAYFAYRAEARPTSEVSYDIYSPQFRIDVDLAGAVRIQRREPRLLGVQNSVTVEIQPDADALLRGDRDAVRRTYLPWLETNAALARALETELGELFAWL